MRYFLRFSVFFLLLGFAARAQDTIYLTDNTTIKGKVLKVGATELEYRRADNATGPAYTIPRNQILLVTYANGTSEVMNQRPTMAPAAPAATPAQRAASGSRNNGVSSGGSSSGGDGSTAPADGVFPVGATVVHLGLGLGDTYSAIKGSTITISPVFHALFERSVAAAGPGTLGVGVSLGYRTIGFGGDENVKIGMIAVRGAFHYPINDQLDVYGGLGLNYSRAMNVDDGGNSSGTNPFSIGATLAGFAGARYYLGPKFGLFAEVGYDLAPFKVGVALKF